MHKIFFLGGITILIFAFFYHSSANNSDCTSLTFLDVGQGDSILLSTKGGHQLLIDAGRGNAVMKVLPQYLPLGDKEIESVILTHSDTDHYEGISSVAKNYKIDSILISKFEKGDIAFEKAVENIENSGAKLIRAEAGVQIDLGEDTYAKIIYPFAESVDDVNSNTSSVVVMVDHSGRKAILTGDAPISVERLLVDLYGETLDSDILKLGHHGSKNSSDENFIKTVSPEIVIVSAGKNNNYGHPNVDVISMVKNLGIAIRSIIDEGSVSFCL